MVTQVEWFKFLKEHDNGLYPSERLGQAFMRVFNIPQDQKLFYMRSRKGAINHIQKTYIENE